MARQPRRRSAHPEVSFSRRRVASVAKYITPAAGNSTAGPRRLPLDGPVATRTSARDVDSQSFCRSPRDDARSRACAADNVTATKT